MLDLIDYLLSPSYPSPEEANLAWLFRSPVKKKAEEAEMGGGFNISLPNIPGIHGPELDLGTTAPEIPGIGGIPINIPTPNYGLPPINVGGGYGPGWQPPSLQLPTMPQPGLPGIGGITAPQLPQLPNVNLPSIGNLPNINLPSIGNLPNINLPQIGGVIPSLPGLPKMEIPTPIGTVGTPPFQMPTYTPPTDILPTFIQTTLGTIGDVMNAAQPFITAYQVADWAWKKFNAPKDYWDKYNSIVTQQKMDSAFGDREIGSKNYDIIKGMFRNDLNKAWSAASMKGADSPEQRFALNMGENELSYMGAYINKIKSVYPYKDLTKAIADYNNPDMPFKERFPNVIDYLTAAGISKKQTEPTFKGGYIAEAQARGIEEAKKAAGQRSGGLHGGVGGVS